MNLFGLLKRKPKAKIPTLKEEDIPRYPPFLRGLPAVTEQDLLASQKDLLIRLKQSVRCDNDHYDKWYAPALDRYARFVHLLPASENHHHCAQGGLLRHGLEAAFYAVQATEGVMFALDATPRERRKVRPCWELAIFLAALGHDLGKVVTDMVVTDARSTSNWDPFKEDLVGWARRVDIERYYVRWKQDRKHKQHELMTPLVIHYLVTEEVKSYLSETAPGALEKLLAAVSGAMIGRNVVQDIMQKADRISTDKDMRDRPVDGGSTGMQVGVPVERNLLDAMRRLVKDGSWKVNENGGRIWIIDKNLYVVWRQGTKETLQLMDKDKVPGIPRDPDTLADILIERDLAIPWNTEEGQRRYWRVAPEMLQKEGKKTVELHCLRFKAAELLIDPAPASISGRIITSPDAEREQIGEMPPTPTKEENKAANPPAEPSQEIAGEPDGTEEQPQQELPKPEIPSAQPEEEPWIAPKDPPVAEEQTPGLEEEIIPPELETPPVPSREEIPPPDEPIEMAMAELILPEPEPKEESSPKKKKKRQSTPNASVPKVNGRPQKIAVLVPPQESPPPQDAEKAQDDQVKEAVDFFENHGMAGEVIKALAEDLASQRLKWGQAAVLMPEKKVRVAVRYPNALEGYGISPKDLLPELSELRWISENYGGKKVFDVEGFGKNNAKAKSLIFEPEISAHILQVAKHKSNLPTQRQDDSNAKDKEKKEDPKRIAQKRGNKASLEKNKPSSKETQDMSDPIHTLILEIRDQKSPFEMVQSGGRQFLEHKKVREWLISHHKYSRSKARMLLMNSEVLKPSTTMPGYLMICEPEIRESLNAELRDTV